MKFTDNFIKNLQPESDWLEKIEASGLGVRVTPSGNKSWFYRFTLNGKRSKMSLGKYPEISLKEARELLFQTQKLKENGINPIEYQKQEKLKTQNTIELIIRTWYEGYIEKNRKQPLQIKQQIEADIIPLLGNRNPEQLHPRDITRALDTIVNRGSPVHANKVLSTLKQAFNYAVSRGDMSANPAAGIRARDIGGLEKPRERYLTVHEIKALWCFLEGDASKISLSIRTAIKIILLTGVRTGEILLGTWNEINFEQSLWTIPANHNKNGLAMKIHLTPLAKQLFKMLQEQRTSNFIISNFKNGEALSDKAIAKAVKRIQERVAIPQWTPHDLRRTFATLMGEVLHVDPVVVEKCLGHKMPKIMATYNRNEMLLQRQEALEKWSSFIENIIKNDV
ncbi:site-specific integrase [uncultured Legionella sp.]|uniref:tyrosine-type recombinase/integrase n=1 Tax=uncultured Legionella sp. TaxID=210934 RepID=UPI00261387BD|nr:site-specific integrase [uncultured Legionella sp.]